MKRTFYAALAATVALPMLATPAAAEHDGGSGYGQSRGMPYAGSGQGPNPPRTPERYMTDRDGHGGPGGYDERAIADDRWADRDAPRRDFDRPNPPPGYPGSSDELGWHDRGHHTRYGRDDFGRHHGGGDHGMYGPGWRDDRAFDPYAGHGWGGRDHHMSGSMHDEMRARHHGGYRDMDFRRDFSQDGRRGYHQDPSYEDLPYGPRPRSHARGAGRGDMRRMRQAMRMIDRFDADGDGRVTQEDIDRYRSDRLNAFDADGDGQLTIDEYAALWADAMRERMVRRFQHHDRDGDGRVTVAEFSERTGDMVRMRDRNRDDALSEEDFMRPRVAAPMGGAPNRPAGGRAPGDDDRADAGARPEVEAPLEDTPNDSAELPETDETTAN